jgi:quinol monooxygenase YgiN
MALKDPNPTPPKTNAAMTQSYLGGHPHSSQTHTPPQGQQVVVLLSRFRPGQSIWGVAQLVLGPLRKVNAPGLLFQKILGSGQEGGFGLRPGLDYQGVFSVFDSPSHAASYLRSAEQVQAYRDHAEEFFAAQLQPISCRGTWSGFGFDAASQTSDQPLHDGKEHAGNSPSGPVASLTRASIRPHKARAFWAQSPDAESELAHADGCQLAVGLGEAPILRQATFSLWESQEAMDAYARSGAHQRAIRAAYGQDFFSESMFVRFRPMALYGRWKNHEFGPAPLRERISAA